MPKTKVKIPKASTWALLLLAAGGAAAAVVYAWSKREINVNATVTAGDPTISYPSKLSTDTVVGTDSAGWTNPDWAGKG